LLEEIAVPRLFHSHSRHFDKLVIFWAFVEAGIPKNFRAAASQSNLLLTSLDSGNHCLLHTMFCFFQDLWKHRKPDKAGYCQLQNHSDTFLQRK